MIASANNSDQTGLNLAQSLRIGYNPFHLTVRGESVEPPTTHSESFDKLRTNGIEETNGIEGINAVDLSSAKPSPEGEGWVRGNQNKEESLFNPPHPNLLPQGEGVGTLKSTALIEGLRTHESFLNVNTIEVAHA